MKTEIGLKFEVDFCRSRGQVILVTVVYRFDLVRTIGQWGVEIVRGRLDTDEDAIRADNGSEVRSHRGITHGLPIYVEGHCAIRGIPAAAGVN